MNRQSEFRVDLAEVRRFSRHLRSAIKLGRREFNVCFVGDAQIRTLNRVFRKKDRATDVLSFPWKDGEPTALPVPRGEFAGFLGEVVISVAAARRNARADRHSLRREINWLVLHGVLHLLGYDHETDGGQMTALEYTLRGKLEGKGRFPRRALSRLE